MHPQQAHPEYRVPENLAWVDGADFRMAESLYLTVLPDGRTVLLKDTARLIWLVASEGGNVLDEVAEPSDAPRPRSRRTSPGP